MLLFLTVDVAMDGANFLKNHFSFDYFWNVYVYFVYPYLTQFPYYIFYIFIAV